MVPNEYLAIGDRWGCFGAVGMLSSAKYALLVHRVPVLVLAYRYCKLPFLAVGFLAPQYRYALCRVSVLPSPYRYGPASK
ncbi:hypothetical protein GQ457_01G010510 [Hibiscus cannabinus]